MAICWKNVVKTGIGYLIVNYINLLITLNEITLNIINNVREYARDNKGI